MDTKSEAQRSLQNASARRERVASEDLGLVGPESGTHRSLQLIRDKISACRECGLCENANNAVPGEGSDKADVMFIGEAPGKDEDIKGEPFVGAAGKFLNTLLESISLSRDDVFITNIVKHRPPNNRDPLPDEVNSCFGFLDAQIGAIKPKLIVTLGRHAMNRFLPDYKISQVHGQAKRVKGAFTEKQVIFPMYHPASALYNPGLRDTLFNDIKKIPILIKKLSEGK